MRRLLATLIALGLGALGLAASAVPASAGGMLTGRLVDATATGTPVVGATVRLRALGAGSAPGAVVDTDTTDADGRFRLDAGPSPDDEYYVQLVAGRYQGGHVGGSPAYVQPRVAYAATYAPTSAIGMVRANPAFIRGVAVDSATGRTLRGIRVTARSSVDLSDVEAADTTNRRGVFHLTGITCEDECYLKLNGAARGYETGYRGCAGGVVPTWGAACGSPIGRIGKVRLDKL